ncbi:lipid kinase, YegS/Rv2252/BmrU family [Sulfobacillus thermosulfidooxidans DSM 9293]|uniref:Lipid kinase, YegS/Rv2252/BmrU family n=1 Tax=Sulfobacillus thermosulfidooxidans (strain DSM 9293 / VKM B-1269 / AT-1) TaxID=929705 RepID=A0A1W1WGZ8_SULTA|nr:diacylglycerol kinase family protein [Sulfobacillus thermosulfidooxidans]SMC05013.1 lipid kinase, YegS/Rv2252/BmrU family [Sulfobacillus thermosulfidooxidans DSM 9293]
MMNVPAWAQGPLRAIINPYAGRDRASKKWYNLVHFVTSWGFSIENWVTTSPKDAENLARQAVDEHASAVFVVGGDGTLNEVVNGLLRTQGPLPLIILVPLGTGSDFNRTVNVLTPFHFAPEKFWSQVFSMQPVMMDVGYLQLVTPQSAISRYFINVADCGLGRLTARLVNNRSKYLGGRMSFIAGSLEAYTLFQPRPVTLTIDGHSQSLSPLVIAMANGAYFGGGMKIAPQASPTDGFLDVVIVDQVARSFFLRHFVEVYQGRHIHLQGVHVIRAQQITMACENIMDIDIDGEDYQAQMLDCQVIPQKLPMLKPLP